MIQNKFQTKDDYRRALEELCIPLKQYYSEGKALVFVGENSTHYGIKTLGLEGFARVLWGLVPLWAGGADSCLDEMVLEGIIHGTDKDHPEYWGDYTDGEQAYVEMGALAYGILMTPEKVWEPLSQEQKHHFQKWISQINTHRISDNNWLFFRILTNCALRRVGAEYSKEQLEADLDRIEDFYLGDGWYSDGPTRQRDYYIGFAMHFYSLIYAKTMEQEDPQRSEIYRKRAKEFADSFVYWFGSRGEALPYGRSLTYRFAQGCFWAAMAFNDMKYRSWGVLKGIVNRHFRDWFERPILDHENKLTIGYGYPNLHMCEGYNSSQSPYWALKSFLVLALPDDHPFWTAREEPLPELDRIKALPHAGMVIQRENDGYVTALTSGQYAEWEPVHVAEKYEKFAYSSYFGFQTPRSYYNLNQAAPDNMLAFVRDGYYHVRRRCDEVKIEGETIISKWRPMEEISVETIISPAENGHVRTHIIHAERPCEAVEGGFSLKWEETAEVKSEQTNRQITVTTKAGTSVVRLEEGEGTPGWIFCESGVNVLHPRTVLPYIAYEIPKGTTKITVYVEGIPFNEK